MTFTQLTQKHIETLKARLEAANIEVKPTRAKFPTKQELMWSLEAQCEKAGISIEVDRSAMNERQFKDFSETGQREILELIRNGATNNHIPYFNIEITLQKGEGEDVHRSMILGNIARDIQNGSTCGYCTFCYGTYKWTITFEK